jgi:hypothetical protein
LFVAFSCKTRGICPSCNGRRMANTSAHLVDRVLPIVPVRQYVLSLPFELRRLAAFRAEVLSALCRIFVQEIFASHRRRIPIANVESGAVTFVQRFGSTLNLNVHFHVVVLDGVFTRAEGGLAFHEAPAPTHDELLAIAVRTKNRALAWLKRKGYVARREDESNETPAVTAMDACAQIALQRGEFADVRATDRAAAIEHVKSEAAAEAEGFNVHAGVRIEADDDMGREKLCRYGARPVFAMDRIQRIPGGRIAYRTKAARGQRARCRIMTPIEFLARLAALIPPPRYPLVRFHGVIAPNSSWRKEVVPKPREPRRELKKTCDERASKKALGSSISHAAAKVCVEREPSVRSAAEAGTVVARFISANVLSVRHWERLENGALMASSPRVDWPTLMRRTFSVDVLACAHCGGRLRVLAVLTEEAAVSKILAHLKMPTTGPPMARARAPDDMSEQAELQW